MTTSGENPASDYRVFTREFDRVVAVSDLARVSAYNSIDNPIGHRWAKRKFWRNLAALESSASLQPAIEDARLKLGAEPELAVSILVDHSGSLRRRNYGMLAAISAWRCAEFLLGMGCAVDLLGFTTRDWGGGRSKMEWVHQDRPSAPGRLTDLLHIVYRSADDPPDRAHDQLVQLLRHRWLKENVDGEAIEWALERLRARPERHKMLLIVSDGAPVDDATLMANGDAYLWNHLQRVLATISERGDVYLAGLGIGYSVERFYPKSMQIVAVADAGVPLRSFLQDAAASAVQAR